MLIYTLELAVLFFAAGFGGCRDRLVDLLAVVLAWADLILQPESFRFGALIYDCPTLFVHEPSDMLMFTNVCNAVGPF